jgi:serine/threonine protein kinase
VNRYIITGKIKAGAMGCTYKARDTRLDKTVAVKMMLAGNDSIHEDEEKINLFRSEAQILSRINHRGLPKVTDFFIEQDPKSGKPSYYLVMSFIDGMDMEHLMELRKQIPLFVEEAMDYFKQILEILTYLHSQEPPIIYRDFKPPNLMLSKGKVFLIDFGIARFLEEGREKAMIGTPGYAAPEQYQGIADQKSDLYSLGVLMHYLLTGINPQDSKQLQFDFKPLNKLNPAVPDYVNTIIMSMLDKDPAKRPSSAEEILDMLETDEDNMSLPAAKSLIKPHNQYKNSAKAEQFIFGFAERMKIGIIIVCLLLIMIRIAIVNNFSYELSFVDFFIIPWAGAILFTIIYFLTRPPGHQIKDDLEIMSKLWANLLSPEATFIRILFLLILGFILIIIIGIETRSIKSY